MKFLLKIQKFQSIFSRFTKREKLILYIATFSISLTLLDRLVILPVYSKIKSLDDEIREKEIGIQKNFRISMQKDRILSETAKYTPFLNSLKYAEEDMTSILKEIEKLANKSSVYLIDLKPAGIKESTTSKKYLVSLECETQMEQLTDFMYNIENSNRLLRIEKYQISPKSKESSIARCSITISKIVMP